MQEILSNDSQPGGATANPGPCVAASKGGISFGLTDTFTLDITTRCIHSPPIGCPYYTSAFTTTLVLTQVATGSFRYRTTVLGVNIDTTVDWTQNLNGSWMWSCTVQLQHQPGYNDAVIGGSPCGDDTWQYSQGGNTLGPHDEPIPTMITKAQTPYGTGSDQICDHLAPISECCIGSLAINGTLNTCAPQGLRAAAGFWNYVYGYVASP